MIVWIDLCIISAGVIAIHECWRPQSMKIMNIVWPINALWGGPAILLLYFIIGQHKMDHHMKMETMDSKPDHRLHFQSVAKATLHCGAGCTLADILSMIIKEIFSLSQGVNFVIAYILAFIFGIYFQYIAQREMDSNTTSGELLKKSVITDFWSLFAWQLGMLITQLVLTPHFANTLDSAVVVMQLAMLVGFFFAYPVNYWLILKGIKKAM